MTLNTSVRVGGYVDQEQGLKQNNAIDAIVGFGKESYSYPLLRQMLELEEFTELNKGIQNGVLDEVAVLKNIKERRKRYLNKLLKETNENI